MISDFEFEDGDKLFKNAISVAQKLVRLKAAVKKAGFPVIYVNDNYGKWQEDFKFMVENCFSNSERAREIIKLIRPDGGDYYVLKPKHSAFYKTVFELLLEELEIETLILTGLSTDICVLFTANDAYMREYKIVVPEDCVAAVTKENSEYAIKYMKRNLNAEITTSTKLAGSIK